ncbi:MAG TPA: hypothetical protein V6D18_14935 [Thermosynechococcaceae cyanobacterium]
MHHDDRLDIATQRIPPAATIATTLLQSVSQVYAPRWLNLPLWSESSVLEVFYSNGYLLSHTRNCDHHAYKTL